MNSRLLIIGVVIAVLIILLVFILGKRADEAPEPSSENESLDTQRPVMFDYEAAYLCEEGGSFRVRFGDRLAEVTLEDASSYTLEEAGQEGGVLYANENAAFVFGADAQTGLAYLEQNGERTHENCEETEGSASGLSEDATLRGTITDINREQVVVDGPALITIQVESGKQAVIAVPSFGINLCAASANIADAFALEVGQSVEVHGSLNADELVIPCESPDHYLRVVET